MPATVTVKVNRAGRAQINEAAAYGMLGVATRVLSAMRSRLPTPPGRSGRATGAMGEAASATLYMRGTEVASEGGGARSPGDGQGEIVAVVGLPFPGRFYETGRTGQPARPVLGPAADGIDVKAVAEEEAARRWPRPG